MEAGTEGVSEAFRALREAMLPVLSLLKKLPKPGEGDELLLSSSLPRLPEPGLSASFNRSPGDTARR